MVIGNDMKTAHMLIVNNYGIALRIVPVTDGATVSYTHLDVYKRQTIDCAACGACGSGCSGCPSAEKKEGGCEA